MLTPFDPFRDLDRLFDAMRDRSATRLLPLDAYRRDGTFFIHFDIPGVDPAAIELTVENDVLTVKAERVWDQREGDELVARERPQGAFERRVRLGENLDLEHLEASSDNGVLTVRVPVRERVRAHKVPITVAETT